MGTIYKQLLMGKKKGDLGHVWVAAHFPHRIRKELVEQTNIGSSVDKILVDQLPVVTYRILGYLLLGVARIYSKKVEYLLLDCNHSLYEMKAYSDRRKKVNINVGGMCLPESSSQRSKATIVGMPVSESSSKKKCNTFIETMRAEFSSISLPETFDLDAFDLEVVEDESSSEHHVKSHLEIVLPDAWEHDQTGHQTFADHDSACAMITNQSNSETSPENLRDRFSMEECLNPIELCEPDEDVPLAIIPIIEQDQEWKNTMSLNDDVAFGDKEHPDNEEHRNEECTNGETMVSEMTLVDDHIMIKPSPVKCQLSVTINETPQTKAPDVSGKHNSDNVAVHTPAPKERSRAPRKRKCVYDDTLVIPNVVYKDWVTNASDLVAKRRKVSLTKSFDSFLNPIIPVNAGFPCEVKTVISTPEPEETMDQMDQSLQVVELGSRDSEEKEAEAEAEEAIAPSTPVTQSASFRFNDMYEPNQEGPTSSSEMPEKQLFLIKGVELDEMQTKEKASSSGAQNQELENWSAFTKTVGSYLHGKFLQRKEKAVNLSQILKEKTKGESARFFFEMLVLKTGGYIDVKQEKAYDEIRVMQTSKLKGVFEV